MSNLRRGGVLAMCALLLAVAPSALSHASAGARAGAATSAQGVSDDEIHVVALVTDLDRLRAKGIQLGAKLTTGNQVKRWQSYFDMLGPINGRKVVVEPSGYDSTDPTSYDPACVHATQDVKPFMVVNGAGWPAQYVPCITVDNKTPLMMQEALNQADFDAAGNRLFTLLPPAKTIGTAAADLAARGMVPKSSKVGIMASSTPNGKEAADALEARLKKLGYAVVSRVNINDLVRDPPAVNRESTAAVATFNAAGVDTVFSNLQANFSVGFHQENTRTNSNLRVLLVDSAPSMCGPTSARTTPPEADGTPCVTSVDSKSMVGGTGIKPDNALEAKCRAAFDKAFDEKSQPGVPAGDSTVAGVTYTEDMSYESCTMVSLLHTAMKKAGKNLTWAKVAQNLQAIPSAPAAGMSDGNIGFGKSKPYAAKNVHVMRLHAANADTPKAANGMFNGCPIPVNCFVSDLVAGKEWMSLTGKGPS